MLMCVISCCGCVMFRRVSGATERFFCIKKAFLLLCSGRDAFFFVFFFRWSFPWRIFVDWFFFECVVVCVFVIVDVCYFIRGCIHTAFWTYTCSVIHWLSAFRAEYVKWYCFFCTFCVLNWISGDCRFYDIEVFFFGCFCAWNY